MKIRQERMSVNVYVTNYIWYVCICSYMYIYDYEYEYEHTYLVPYEYVHVSVCVSVSTCEPVSASMCVYTYIYTCLYACVCVRIRACICVCIYICICVCERVHVNTSSHKCHLVVVCPAYSVHLFAVESTHRAAGLSGQVPNPKTLAGQAGGSCCLANTKIGFRVLGLWI